MKATILTTVLVFVLALMFWPVKVAGSEPMGTAFTYQGWLMDANHPANGIYDLTFVLYPVPDGPAEGELGLVMSEDVNIVDGFFTIELEFGSGVFDGNDRWLQIEVRPGELHDPNVYTILTPRQRITPTPYAIYAERAGSAPGGGTDGGPGGIGGGGTTNYIPKFTASSSIGDSVIYQSGDNVGIGTTSPDAKLHVNGLIKISNGSPGTGKVLTSDDTGLASWQTPTGGGGPDGDWAISGNNMYAMPSGNVGVGTSSPTTKLDVNGQMRVRGGSPGAGKVLTSDATGLASWQTPTGTGGPDDDWTISGNDIYHELGNVGIGTSGPTSMLHVTGSSSQPAILGYNAGNGAGIRGEGDTGNGVYGESSYGIGVHGHSDEDIGVYGVGDNAGVKAYGDTCGVWAACKVGWAGYFEGPMYFQGNVGIGTLNPNGKLDVNGSIYQRGSSLHADYVFEPDYQLESIDEHSEFMWMNKHLKAIPKSEVDEGGREILEVGAHRKGIVEELEKAHIYIEQLHNRLKKLEEKEAEMQKHLASMESLLAKLTL
ncbi:MAG: hypothetical protein ACYTFW_17960 [Planctomycetota bacterium]|jgi:hypothetical protein